jgi:hypothetical protein
MNWYKTSQQNNVFTINNTHGYDMNLISELTQHGAPINESQKLLSQQTSAGNFQSGYKANIRGWIFTFGLDDADRPSIMTVQAPTGS